MTIRFENNAQFNQSMYLKLSRLLVMLLGLVGPVFADDAIPHLRKQGTATQLMVHGEPFLIRGGELGNSTGEPDYLRQYWPKLKGLNLNTVVAPIYWELTEPEEGKFDFSTLDGLLKDARAHEMHLVLLWFGVWKNSMSSYAPAWVKRDFKRFPRSQDSAGTPMEIVSPFSAQVLDADVKAFRALMKHLRAVDQKENTVVMVQVENEIGMIPEARDHSPEAERKFGEPVPESLMSYFIKNADTLSGELRDSWVANGKKTAGTWTEVFGGGVATDEIFMAWHFSRFVEEITAKGKAEYPLPMYVNAALIRPGHKPGQYPSAGPLPHLFDIWRAGAPSLDLLAPDIYFNNFVEWVRKYARSGNPLFIPEALRSVEASVNGIYAIAGYDAIGFCPFGIESIGEPAARYLTDSFGMIAQLTPLILEHQGRGTMTGLLPEGSEQRQPQQVWLGGYTLHVSFEKGTAPDLADGVVPPYGAAINPAMPPTGGLVIATAPDEFIIAGSGITTTFQLRSPGGPQVGLLSVEEGRYVDGKWTHLRWLNGDQTHQGRHVRLDLGRFGIQKVKLYQYR
jgi:beta-galactosidase GanA